MTVSKRACMLMCAAITVFAATETMAQFGGGAGGRRGGGRSGQSNTAKEQPLVPQENSPAQLQVILEELRVDLKLTPAQQPAWDSYAEKVEALASDMARERRRAQPGAQINAAQQLDHTVDVARDRLTAIEDIASAAKALYGSLSGDQKTIADSRLAKIIPASAGDRSSDASARAGKRRDSQ
jgi:periplasmic protein CpxP/Spy